MINFADRENITKLIELEKISLTSTLDIQKNLNKQILIFIKNFIANVTFSYDINPNDRAFFYLNESTNALSKSNSNINVIKRLIEMIDGIAIKDELLEDEVKKYNDEFKNNINSIYESTEIIEEFVHRINTTVLSELAKDLTMKNEEVQDDVISNKELEISYIENTLVISEEQKRVILPYTIAEIKEKLISQTQKYTSIQEVIDNEYTKPISYYKFSAIARFREAYRLVRDRENGSKIKALELACELFLNYNLHPAIITACKTLDQLDVYLACLEDNTLDEFEFFDVKYEIPLVLHKNIKNAIV